MRKMVLLYDYDAYLALVCPFCTALVVNPAFGTSTGIFRIVVLKVNLIFALYMHLSFFLFFFVW